MWRTNLSAIRGLEYPHEVELSLDGARLLLATIGGARRSRGAAAQSDGHLRRDRDAAAAGARARHGGAARARGHAARRDAGEPAGGAAAAVHPRLRQPVRRRACAARAVDHGDRALQRHGRRQSGEPPPVRVPSGRRRRRGAVRAPHRRRRSAAARSAGRSPPAETAALLDTYRRERAAGSFDTGVEAVLRRILASPSFVFRPEAEPAGASPGSAYARERLRAGVAAVVLSLELAFPTTSCCARRARAN